MKMVDKIATTVIGLVFTGGAFGGIVPIGLIDADLYGKRLFIDKIAFELTGRGVFDLDANYYDSIEASVGKFSTLYGSEFGDFTYRTKVYYNSTENEPTGTLECFFGPMISKKDGEWYLTARATNFKCEKLEVQD